MKLSDIKKMAAELMQSHQLNNTGWEFKFDNSKVRFGHTQYSTKIISVSRKLGALNDESRVKNTILHEIAHALCGPGTGHDRAWKYKAMSIGCDGNRCYESTKVISLPRPWQAQCEHHGKLNCFRHKRRFGKVTHIGCGGMISWIKNEVQP